MSTVHKVEGSVNINKCCKQSAASFFHKVLRHRAMINSEIVTKILHNSHVNYQAKKHILEISQKGNWHRL